MQTQFDLLIDSYLLNQVGEAPHFLQDSLALLLRENLIELFAQQQMKLAGTGNQSLLVQDKLFRSDKIYWLDRAHQNVAENLFFDMIDAFVVYLNATCYTGITGYEFHYALYEKGSFYKKHLDQFKNNDSRQYSMIMYLNEGWLLEDGGELLIHHANKENETIEPRYGKGVFFKSNELEHEVLIAHKTRMSVTGWFKVD